MTTTQTLPLGVKLSTTPIFFENPKKSLRVRISGKQFLFTGTDVTNVTTATTGTPPNDGHTSDGEDE